MSRRPVHLAALGLGLALATLPACSSGTQGASRSQPIARTYVRVNNQSWLDMTVYVVRGAQKVRIGQVSSNATTRLEIPHGMISGATTLSFMVDPIGSQRTATSFDLTVTPGETVQLTIPATVR
ncbi:MAG TPA: hypothetical protein VGD77_10325 [Gemmatimonadaceae bacterium]